MDLYAIDFYERFHCLAQDCPVSCCKSWKIMVDDADYSRYRKEPGLFGLCLRLFCVRDAKHKQRRVLRHVAGRCPYYTTDRLCGLQKKNRTDLQPLLCRIYPRRSVSYGTHTEITMELSCIQAAKLFLKQPGKHVFQRVEAVVPVFYEVPNEDRNFLKFLLRDRDRIMDYIWKEGDPFPQKMLAVYHYVYAEYMWIVRDRQKEAEQLSLPLTSAEKEQADPAKLARVPGEYALYPVGFLNELIYEWLSYGGLRFQNKRLYRLVRQYKKIFGKVLEKDADFFFNQKVKEMLRHKPELADVIQAYYAYLFQQTYCEAYADYYILGPVLLCGLHTEIFVLFLVVAYLSKDALDLDSLAFILADTEKSIRHNNALKDWALEKIRKDFFAP